MKNIVLIGMTGAGKTTVGEEISKRFNLKFLDTDKLIEEKISMTPRQIVKTLGKEFFLDLQNEVIQNISVENAVISTGGGVVEIKKAIEYLKKLGMVFYLDVDYEILEERFDDSRPLSGSKEKSFYELWLKRDVLYKKYADVICKCGEQSVDEIANWIFTKNNGV